MENYDLRENCSPRKGLSEYIHGAWQVFVGEKKKVMGRRSWAVLGFWLTFGVVFGGFLCRATHAHYPKPCLVNNFLVTSAV